MSKKLNVLFSVILLVCFVAFSGTALAEDNEALRNEVKELRGVVNELQGQVRNLSTMQGHITPTPGKEPLMPYVGAGEQVPGGFVRTLSDIHMGGYIDVQYSQALNDGTDHRAGAGAGAAQNTATNPGRVFDTDQDSFTLNAIELNFQRSANPEGGAGFRADIAIGEDSEVVDFDMSTDRDEFSIQQAYIEYVQPLNFWEGNEILPDTVNFKAGRFVTLAGAEVIEAPDNWNVSRSFAFGLAIPFTHLGVRSNFQMFNDFLDVYLGLNNGWDNVVDNNDYRTLETGLGWSPIENVSFFHSLYWGPENNDQSGHKRFLTSHVVSVDLTDKFSVKGEFNQGFQNRVLTGTETNSADWQSYAGYARYQLTDKFAMAYRAEIFKQDELNRTTLDDTLWEQTLTAEHKLTDNLIARLEYRYDKADSNNAFDLDSNQQTLGGQVIYLIG